MSKPEGLRRAVFLDRDGVVIRSNLRHGKPYAITDGEPVEVLPGVDGACERLKAAGYVLVLTTNQPDVARGKTSRRFVDETNAALAERLGLEGVEVCLHDDADACACRKPRPGLMTGGAARLGLSLVDSFVVGDRWRDIEAGRNAGCRTILIDYGYDERRAERPDSMAASLSDAADWILACG